MGSAKNDPKDFVQLAADAAAELEREFKGQPQKEFIAWLQIALQREAMVSASYQPSFVESQLKHWQQKLVVPADVVEAVRAALESVWAQETAHQQFFRSMLFGVYKKKTLRDRLVSEMERLGGYIQGVVIGGLTSPNAVIRHIAGLIVTVGKYLSDVPEYVRRIGRTDFPQFCSINADLELTAVSGYERMLALAEQLKSGGQIPYTTLLPDLNRTASDERYHHALFRALATWPPPPPIGGGPGVGPPPLAAGTPQSQGATLASLRELVELAQAGAYGHANLAFGSTVMQFDEEAVQQDPLIVYLREFVEIETELSTPEILYASADATEASQESGAETRDDDDDPTPSSRMKFRNG